MNLDTRVYRFSLIVVRFIQKFDPKDPMLWAFRDQLLRSSTSIGANVIEAKGSISRPQFIRYYHIALQSAYETYYWLVLLQHCKLLPEGTNLPVLLQETIALKKILRASLKTLKQSNY